MQEAAAEKFEQLFEAETDENLEPNVSEMLAKKEDLAGTPYRTRTCDPLIKSQVDIFPVFSESLRLESAVYYSVFKQSG